MAGSVAKPLKDLPGGYGLPIVGALKDRLDYYWFKGDLEYFESRIKEYNSTVFRVNFPPGPPGFPDGKGIAVLDQESFAILMDNGKVNKADSLLGSFMPDLDFTGGYRVLPYLDTTEEKHTLYKNLMFDILRTRSSKFFPAITKAFEDTSSKWEDSIGKSGKVEVFGTAGNMVIRYLFGTVTGQDPTDASMPDTLGEDPHTVFQTWAGVQFAGIAYTKLPHLTEELLMHSFRLPFFPVKNKYESLVRYMSTYCTEFLDLAVSRYGLDRKESVHHLVFTLGINGRLGLLKMIPVVIYYIAKLGSDFQARLAKEVRSVMKSTEDISTTTLVQMPLVKSTVLEALRMMPSIFQIYGHAREDLEVESHEARFKVSKGELLGSHIYFVLRDPAVFKNPHEFDPERFLGPEGEKLMPYLVWSNGRENDAPTATDKQCAGKNLAELFTMQFIAEMFLKYDSFEITPESKITTTELDVYFKSLVKRAV